jgi:methylated-DNA-protein-cysteine methyltransferase-like protein
MLTAEPRLRGKIYNRPEQQILNRSEGHRLLDELRKMIRKVPRGKVSTYGAIAAAAGHAGAARQVVWALRSSGGNLPWHRILGAGGLIKTTGEDAMEQRFRLEMEGVKFVGRKVDMKRCEHKFPKKRKPIERPPKR